MNAIIEELKTLAQDVKILYVEDDLGGNIPRILNLFGDILPNKIVKALSELDANEGGANSEDVKALLDKSPTVQACYDFADAIQTVKENWRDFNLFILDRNLTDGQGEWDPDEICKSAGIEDQELLLPFLTREGDFLVHLIPWLHVDFGNMVYFLTANTTDAELRNTPEFRISMHARNIGSQNFIQKSDPEACQRLREVIANIDELLIRSSACDLFAAIGLCAPEAEEDLVDILRQGYECKANKRRSAMAMMRTITEASVDRLCAKYGLSLTKPDGTKKAFRTKASNVCEMSHDDAAEALFMVIQRLGSGRIHIDTEGIRNAPDRATEDEYMACYSAFRLVLTWSGQRLGKGA